MSWGCTDILKCSQYELPLLNSCKYLKSETHLQNTLVNKVSSINIEIVKTCLIANIVRKNWSQIATAVFGLHYVVSTRFGSF